MSDPVPAPVAAEPTPWSFLARFWFPLTLVAAIGVCALVWFKNAFDDQGYAPVQPIAFSHKLHAGDLKIDCNYCHFNASRGKHAGVPPMSVCMGCHTQVATDKPEIVKLTEIYETGTAKTADGTIQEGGVVHWARIHKLPDHVYFNHQAHVAAGVSCQTCHGPVEEMVRVRQFSDLTMAWCLECHRNTNYVGNTNPAGIAVGTPDYHSVRTDRQVKDAVVQFVEHGKGHGEAHAEAKPADAAPAASAKDESHLPVWKRSGALPASHQHLMNAATQCSTCHQ